MLSLINLKEKLQFPRWEERKNWYTPIRLLHLFLIPFLITIVYRYHSLYGVSQIVIAFSIGLALWLSTFFFKAPVKVISIYVLLLFLGSIVGYMRMTVMVDKVIHEESFFVGGEVCLEGKVQDWQELVRKGEVYKRIVVAPTSVASTKVTGKGIKSYDSLGSIYVYAKEELPIQIGDVLLVQGKVSPFSYSYEPGDIDMRPRYMGEGMVGSIFNPVKIELKKIDTLSFIEAYDRILCHFRQRMEVTFRTYLTEEDSLITSALLLGAEYSKLPDIVNESFAATGLIHILSVSGSHIAVLIATSMGIGKLLKIPRSYSYLVAIFIISLYASLVGYSSPVVRSSLVGTFCALGWYWNRPYVALQALSWIMLGQLMYNPFLVQDISFQLSYGATYGILLWYPLMIERIHVKPRWIRMAVGITLSAQLLVLPFQIYYFHQLSWISFLSNIIIGPLLEVFISMGLISTVLATVMPYFDSCWQVVYELLSAILHTALWLDFSFAKWPYAVQEVAIWNTLESGCYGLFLLGLHGYLKRYLTVLLYSAVGLVLMGIVLFQRAFFFAPSLAIYSHTRLQVIGVHTTIDGGIVFVGSAFPGMQESDGRYIEKWLKGKGFKRSLIAVGSHKEAKILQEYFKKRALSSRYPIGILKPMTILQGSIQIQIFGTSHLLKKEEDWLSHWIIRIEGKEKVAVLHSGQAPKKVVQLIDNKEYIWIGSRVGTHGMVFLWQGKGDAFIDPLETDSYVIGKESLPIIYL